MEVPRGGPQVTEELYSQMAQAVIDGEDDTAAERPASKPFWARAAAVSSSPSITACAIWE